MTYADILILLKAGYTVTEIVQTTVDGKRVKHPVK